MKIKEILLECESMHKRGYRHERILKKVKAYTNNEQEYIYIKTCFYYNRQNYSKAINCLIENFEQSQLLDTTLFGFLINWYLNQNNIDYYKLSKLLAIYSKSKIYFSKENSLYLSKTINDYILRCYASNKPMPFNLLSTFKELITKKTQKLLTKHQIDNTHTCKYLEENIDFKKIKDKKIVQCFYNDSSSGVGDFLRGCCFLFDLFTKKHGIKVSINFSNHDINHYLKTNEDIKVKQESILDIEKINKNNTSAIEYFENIKNNIIEVVNSSDNTIYICSNYSDIINYDPEQIYNYQISDECCSFMKSNLIFSKDIKSEYKSIIKDNNIKEYEIVHFRCGDVELISANILDAANINTKKYDISYQDLWKMCLSIKNNTDKQLIIMSDSNDFKKYCKNQIKHEFIDSIFVLHEQSQHCSNQPGKITNISIDKKSKINNMFYVALDMFILSKASKIHSRSVYPWGSGFVFWIAKIFNIPISGRKIG
jgi:hypothetical protein